MAPIIKCLEHSANFQPIVCVTGQHREMLDQVLQFFDIEPDYDLDLMAKSRSLSSLVSEVMQGVSNILDKEQPDISLVHGDTATSLGAGLAAFFNKTKLGHVEAGLRTRNKLAPWPEETNRTLIGQLADFHFAPTVTARENLMLDHVAACDIVITGNTVIDALKVAVNKIKGEAIKIDLDAKFGFLNSYEKKILVTCHRRENFDQLDHIFHAIRVLAEENPKVAFVFPVHLNPRVANVAQKVLTGFKNVYLVEPLGYAEFVYVMMESYFILTDSGGIQEEAPFLNKPVLLMRDTTERPEAVQAGTVKLCGSTYRSILEGADLLLNDNSVHAKMSEAQNPYGDGNASILILDFLRQAS